MTCGGSYSEVVSSSSFSRFMGTTGAAIDTDIMKNFDHLTL